MCSTCYTVYMLYESMCSTLQYMLYCMYMLYESMCSIWPPGEPG